MNKRERVYEIVDEEGGTLVDYTNDTEGMVDTVYASLTARSVVRCEVKVDDELVDIVFAGLGGSHSWWTGALGKLLSERGLLPGQRLLITVDGPAAMRINWC